jgi:hypothetical protein
MDLNKTEVAALERAVSEVNEHQVKELNDLQLVLVGGGIGEVVFG